MKKYIFLFVTGFFFVSNTFSQSIGVTDFMRLNPYSNLNNPAYFLPYHGYVGIPVISNFNFSLYNSGFHYKNLFEMNKERTGGTITINKFVNSLSKNNWFNTNLNLELLGFGFRVDKFFFSFGYRLKIDENFRYSKDLFGFLLRGNLAQNSDEEYLYTKTSPALLEIAPNINIYQEMSIGFQGQILNRLYVGVRPKILFGLLNLKTEKFDAKVYSNPEDYTIYGNYDVSMNVASAIPLYEKDADGNLVFSLEHFSNLGNNVSGLIKNCFSKNLGFAIDLGAVYRINRQIRVSASLTDLGFIKWKGTPLNMSIKPLEDGKDYEFSGFTSNQITNFMNNGITINLDSIVNNNFMLSELQTYTAVLTSKFMVDGYFDLTPSNRFILQFKGYILGKNFIPQFTIAYNGSFFNVFDLVISYSMMKKSYDNLGVGLGVRIGPVHLYAGTDNALAAVNLLNASKMNATFGLLVDFPIRKKVKEAELNSMFKQNETKESSDTTSE